MALLEPPVETSSKTRHLKFIAGALAVLAAVALYFTFRFYPEQRVVQRFFDALVARLLFVDCCGFDCRHRLPESYARGR